MKKITLISAAILAYCILHTVSCFSQGAAININGSAADSSAMLDISSTSKGMLVPRMTTTERNNIVSPAQSLIIYNVTTRCFEFYEVGIWQNFACSCTPPSAPAEGTHTPQQTQITWNWNTVSGATGYKWSTANNYSGATDMGTNTSYIESSLTCNTPYTRYVWAYGNCGNSSSTTLTQTTSACGFSCGSNVTFDYKGGSVTYGSMSGANGRCWLDRNLGASQVATAYNDASAYGDLFQWGRLDDAHQNRNSATTTTLSGSDTPGHSNYILAPASPFDWRSPQNNNLWQGSGGTNNPCPSGWKIPTSTEWNTERLSWATQNTAGAFNALKLTSGGDRLYDNGIIRDVAFTGCYWTSYLNGGYPDNLYFDPSSAVMTQSTRAHGLSVRCIKE